MTDIVNISDTSVKMLDSLSSSLRLAKNIVCRMSIAVSLQSKNSVDLNQVKQNAVHIDLSPILESDKDVFFAMASQQLDEKFGMADFNKVMEFHLENGLKLLSDLYTKTNSSTDFFKELCSPSVEMYIDTEDSNSG
ncbi:MAG: DndE family protein [Candidatus Methanomethylophilaceae archaeon]|jgi:DNA sulfur modification protein DndE